MKKIVSVNLDIEVIDWYKLQLKNNVYRMSFSSMINADLKNNMMQSPLYKKLKVKK